MPMASTVNNCLPSEPTPSYLTECSLEALPPDLLTAAGEELQLTDI
jgi:hypothetical protein